MLIKTLGDWNTICFLTSCWMFNSDFFSCPTILRITALFPATLLSLLSRQMNLAHVPSVFRIKWSVLASSERWWLVASSRYCNKGMRSWTDVIQGNRIHRSAVLAGGRLSLTKFKRGRLKEVLASKETARARADTTNSGLKSLPSS